MNRSISFVAEGDVRTLVTVTDNQDGTLTFDINVIGGIIGDLRAVFFDLNDGYVVEDGDLYIVDQAQTDVTDTASGEGDIDTLGKDANIKGSVSNELGDFDAGIEFGTSGMSGDDIQSTSFTLASQSTGLTLEMLSFADFGFRYTSVGEEGGNRTASAKIGDTTGGTAANDSITLNEEETASIDLLLNDAALGSVVEQTVTLASASGVFGSLVIRADGTATVVADGPAADALNDGESASFVVSYEVVDGDDIATASLTVTIEGETDQTLLPLFTEARDEVDFNTLEAGVYDPASFYDALGGNDRVFLPTAEKAAELGFDLSQTFTTGDDFNSVFGSTGDDRVSFGGTNNTYVDLGGDDHVTGTGGTLTIRVREGGNDVYDFGTGRNVINYFDLRDGVIVDLAAGTATGTAGNQTLLGSVTDLVMTMGDDVVYGTDDPSQFDGRYRFTFFDGNDTFYGGTQNDILFLQAGTGVGHKTIDGDGGYDYLVFNGVTSDMIIDIAAGSYSGWGTGTFTNVEEYQLGDGSDFVNGSEARDVVLARLGDDTIYGNGGGDVIYDGAGNSLIDGGAGNDVIFAATGQDHYEGGAGVDRLDLTRGGLSNGVFVNLGTGELIADGTNSTFSGFEQIRDGLGDDTFVGSSGDDFLQGEFGNNTLTGGLGADDFWFAPSNGRFGDNVITDFNAAEGDQLVLSGAGYVRQDIEVGDDVVVSLTDGAGNLLGTITLLDTTLLDLV